ncbi:MAG: lipid-A-disaccharide synthase N-terminal domain-containing protein [Candidatus Omnitrophica bacterium]|nr:lipid-A-disaccharide synthase N-terminal domain-containing protein [Candidatus Omnitrophota bacterium]
MKLSIPIEVLWLGLGLLGQFLFFLRFFSQWLVSEKRKESITPLSFWYFSILGGLLLLSYAIYRKDPVFILGQSLGIFIYARNLYFIYRKKL